MPRGDGTGPAGYGPMTGRAAGFCAGYQSPGFANPLGRRGMGFWGRGGGMGRGFRSGAFPAAAPMGAAPLYPEYGTTSPDQERAALRNQAEYLESNLQSIKQRLAELEKSE